MFYLYFFFYVDYVKGTKWLAKKLQFKRRFACLWQITAQEFVFSGFKGLHGVLSNVWCQSSKWGGRGGGALYFQQSFGSWIPQRNVGLQLGDRTMEWAIYGWLLTTPAFRPLYCKQVFYESACCLFPTTFRVSILTPDQGFNTFKQVIDDSSESHGLVSYMREETLVPLHLNDEYFLCHGGSLTEPLLGHKN